MISGAKQTQKIDDSKTTPTAQLSYLGQSKNVPYITPYGFFSSPPVNSTWLIFPLRDNDDDIVGFGNDFKRRPEDLEEGDVCLFNTLSKAKIVLRTTGDIEIFAPRNISVTAGLNCTINATTANINVATLATVVCPQTIWTGNITLTGNLTQVGDYSLTGTGTSTIDFVSNGKSGAGHTHTSSLPGTPTSPPN